MQMRTYLTSEAEGPSGSLHARSAGAPVGTESAGHRTFPASPFFTPGRFRTGSSLSTHRADAGPTDKG